VVEVPAFRPLAAPRFKETAIDGPTVHLRWNAVLGATRFGVYRAHAGADPLARDPIAVVEGALSADDAPGDGKWTWAVVAIAADGRTSAPSDGASLDVRNPIPPA